jgi:hypothetical protein
MPAVLCAAVVFSDDEHLYTYELPLREPRAGCSRVGREQTDVARSEIELCHGHRSDAVYDMGATAAPALTLVPP